MANSADLQKLTDLDLHCLQKQTYPGSAGLGLKANIVYITIEETQSEELSRRKILG